MIEPTLSVVAWMSVVLIQAIVHFAVLGGRRRTGDDINPSTDAQHLLETKLDRRVPAPHAKMPVPQLSLLLQQAPLALESDEDESSSMEVDEANDFLQMLGQTGSEMMKSCTSQNLVREQLTRVDIAT